MFVLLALNATSPNIKSLTAAAFHEWARLISIGEEGVSLIKPPPAVDACKNSRIFNYEGVNPAYRPKGKPTAVPVDMLYPPEDEPLAQQPPPASSRLTVYSQAGPVAGFALPSAAPGDADLTRWTTYEKRVWAAQRLLVCDIPFRFLRRK